MRAINYGGRHEFLRELHKLLRPKRYLEIGVQFGRSIQLAEIDCHIIGIDPAPQVGPALADAVHTMTSDEYFQTFSPYPLNRPDPPAPHPPVDFAFIDGSHLAEDTLRDFMNVERVMAPGGVIALDDVVPYSPAIAGREPLPGDWAGDVYKLRGILERLRPDLLLTLVDVDPTGLLVVQRLDPSSMELPYAYDMLETEIRRPVDEVPGWAWGPSNCLQPADALDRIWAQYLIDITDENGTTT